MLTLLFDEQYRIESGDTGSNFKTTPSLLSGLTHALSNRQVVYSPALYDVRPTFSHWPFEHVFSNNTPQDILIIVQRDATQSNLFYFSSSSLYIFRVSTTPIITSTQNCNYSLRYWSYFLCSYLPPTWPNLTTLEGGSSTSTGGCSYNCVYSR